MTQRTTRHTINVLNIANEITFQLRYRIMTQSCEIYYNQIWCQINKDVLDQVFVQVKDEVMNKVKCDPITSL